MATTESGGESLFGSNDESIIRKQAQNLLNDYSHPWDPLAEAVQNSVDAINRKYRHLLAEELSDRGLDLDEEAVREGIDECVDEAVEAGLEDYRSAGDEDEEGEDSDGDVSEWGEDGYEAEVRERWYELLAEELNVDSDEIADADEAVRDNFSGEIIIQRDKETRSLTIKDNGIGMDFDEFKYALKKGGSLKANLTTGTSEIGELGNGLTYMACSCNQFRMETCRDGELSEVEINSLLDWIEQNGTTSEPKSDPSLVNDDVDSDSYSSVTMDDVREVDADYPDIFDESVSTERFAHLLRSKTAIGHLYETLNFPVFDTLRGEEIEISLTDSEDDNPPQEISFSGPVETLAEKHDE